MVGISLLGDDFGDKLTIREVIADVSAVGTAACDMEMYSRELQLGELGVAPTLGTFSNWWPAWIAEHMPHFDQASSG